MRSHALILSTAGLLVLAFAPAGGQRPAAPSVGDGGVSCADPKMLCDHVWKLAASVSELQFEVGRMKQELLQVRLERQRALVARSAAELEQLAAEQRKLDDEETGGRQDLQAIDEHLQQGDLSSEQRAESEAARDEIARVRLQEVEAGRAAVAARAEDIRQALERDKQGLLEIEVAARQALAGPGLR